MWREGGKNEQCRDKERQGHREGDEWGLRAGKLDRRRGVNEDGEWLQISGDGDCELCAGNKQGRK